MSVPFLEDSSLQVTHLYPGYTFISILVTVEIKMLKLRHYRLEYCFTFWFPLNEAEKQGGEEECRGPLSYHMRHSGKQPCTTTLRPHTAQVGEYFLPSRLRIKYFLDFFVLENNNDKAS